MQNHRTDSNLIRTIILTIIFLLAGGSSYAQTDSIQNYTYHSETISQSSIATSYKSTTDWKTYKKLKIAGWSCIGVGIPATFYGIVAMGLSQVHADSSGGIFIAVTATGGTLTLTGITLLIIANKYKKKAKNRNLNIGISDIKTPSYTGYDIYSPAIRLTYSF